MVVRVRIIDISWLNENIANFYEFLSTQRPTLFDNDLIRILLHTQNYTFDIVWRYFLPYCIYMTLVLYYFINYVPMPIDKNETYTYWKTD